jgi:hypothetical protein
MEIKKNHDFNQIFASLDTTWLKRNMIPARDRTKAAAPKTEHQAPWHAQLPCTPTPKK